MEASENGATPARPRALRLDVILHVVAAAGLVFAYSGLLTVGTRYGFARGVEYWLFRPTDYAPLVVIALAAWLAYRRWNRIRVLPRRMAPAHVVAPLLAAGLAVHGWSIYTRAHDLQVLSLVFTLSGLVAAYWGVAGLRALWLPICFLLFAIPLPAPLLLDVIFDLQMWTASYSGWILYAMGVPALVSGDQILRASQAFQVIEGCSGMRSMQTLTMLTVLLVDLFGRRGWHAAILLIAAPILAFVLNGFRVVTLILNPHSEIVAIHNLQGIVILLVGVLVVYGLDGLLQRVPALRGRPWRAPAPQADAAGSTSPSVQAPLATLLVVAFASVAATLWMPVWQDPAGRLVNLHGEVSGALAEWPSEKLEADYAFRGSMRMGEAVERRYMVDGEAVYVFVATADLGQRGGSVRSPVTGLPGSGWVRRDSREIVLAADGRAASERVFEKGKLRVLVRHWYVADRGLGRETLRSLLALDRSPFRRPETTMAVRLATPVASRREEDRAAAAARLDRIYDRLAPVLRRVESGATRVHARAPALDG